MFCVGHSHLDGLQLLLSVVNGGILTYDMVNNFCLAIRLTVGRATYIKSGLWTKQPALENFQKSYGIDMRFM